MLLVISFTYLVTLLPLVLVSIILDISLQTNIALAKKLFRRLYNVSQILELVSEINYAINFFIYVISGAQFRRQLQRMCHRKRRRFTYIAASSPAQTERIYRRSLTKKPTSAIWRDAHHDQVQEEEVKHRKPSKTQTATTAVSHVWR